IRNLARNLLAQGASGESLTRTIAALNDALTREVIALTLQANDIGDINWCWLALGSEGRGEQTLSTDQDNALIFVPAQDDNPERVRHDLIAFAREVNAALDALGFPLCKGGIMASNPEWCLTADEWRLKFTHWIAEPTPVALLNANIFFDLRALHGDAALADDLSHWLLARTAESKLFLRLMVANALQTEPPLGLIRAFEVADGADGDGMLDLKTRGTRIFVDAARVFALGHGIADAGTLERIRRAGEMIRADPKHVAATVEAFNFLQVLRLRTQDRSADRSARVTPNRIDPYKLNEVDQRMLKEALRQARKLQQRLKETYAFAL
ncbi:MAG: DUF294 nucleotidyltransferase-like domain-containing protein, partial [Burkholderiaceae bacterium]|nr:DUF294 nucleotidyltransferase-like domain-containing protein [Burkholderiaceae bacterium]